MRNNYIDIKIILVTTLIGLINSFFYADFAVMLGLCSLEVIILVYYFFKNEDLKYLCAYLIFLCLSYESGNFVGSDAFYGFKNFRIGGLNLAVIMLLPMLIKALISKIKFGSNSAINFIIRQLTTFTFLGGIMGLVYYGFDDNGFASKPGSVTKLINSYYGWILPFAELLVASYVLVNNSNKLYVVKKYLFSVIVAIAIVFVACLLLGNFGNRAGLISLQIQEVSFLLIPSVVLLAYDVFDKKTKIVVLISSLTILGLSLMFNSSGKSIIITVMIPILLMIVLSRQNKSNQVIFFAICFCFFSFIVAEVVLPFFLKDNILFEQKLNDVINLLNFSGDASSWLDNMPESPRMRVAEFLNICAEYLHKPYAFFLGKGFCGTAPDVLNLYRDLSEAAFSDWELELKAYNGMHESINAFFLVGGVLGLVVLFRILLVIYNNIHKSPWLVFGGMWMLLLYNYHMSLTIYGVVCLVVGFIDISKNR